MTLALILGAVLAGIAVLNAVIVLLAIRDAHSVAAREHGEMVDRMEREGFDEARRERLWKQYLEMGERLRREMERTMERTDADEGR